MNLRECFDCNGCDKGSRHGYERVYEPAFKGLRQEPLRILEIGIYKGASLAAWIDYFPNATIFGIDTFQRVESKSISMLNHPRVEWRQHDSTTPADFGRFDFIIDDGSHTHKSQRKTFEAFMPYCDGTYFIEDVYAFDHMSEDEKRIGWLQQDSYSAPLYAKLLEALEPYDVEFHDLRDGYQPDSFIIEVTT